MLEQSTAYNPNEEESKPEHYGINLGYMKNKSTALIHANKEYTNARLIRDQILYNNVIRICQDYKEVKQYVKSVFGVTSPQ
ncbi:hypothetical protein ASE55_18355 [Chryseobacterium sp. Leaf201]|nr:hypothetical protein ASE55_18355 [Chryseobacterium sp. Leaf201]